MDAVQFLNSVYLGDRSITGITVDSSNMTIKIHDIISRIRSKDGNWNYYTDEMFQTAKLSSADVRNSSLIHTELFPMGLLT